MNITHFRLPVGCWSVGFLTCLCSGFICFGTLFQGLFCSGTCVFGVAGGFVLRIVDWARSISFLQNWVWGSFSPFLAILPFGCYCWFWRVWPCWQQSWVRKSWTGGVGRFLGFLDFGVWLPCMLAWWGLLSLSGYDACWVIKPTRAPGGKSGLKHGKTSLSPLSIFLVSSHSLKFFGDVWFGISGWEGPDILGLVLALLALKF